MNKAWWGAKNTQLFSLHGYTTQSNYNLIHLADIHKPYLTLFSRV